MTYGMFFIKKEKERRARKCLLLEYRNKIIETDLFNSGNMQSSDVSFQQSQLTHIILINCKKEISQK